jgi:hypothetical protein
LAMGKDETMRGEERISIGSPLHQGLSSPRHDVLRWVHSVMTVVSVSIV